MRSWIVSFLLGAVILAGCCPEVMKKRKEAKEALQKKVEEPTTVSPTVPPAVPPTVPPPPAVQPPKVTPPETPTTAKASPTEIAIATKGADIPQTPVPPGTQFKKPEEISPEIARIFQNIYFDFDRYDLKPQAQAVLKDIATFLLQNPGYKIMIEGHCDERGTREYNLALGEQRSLSARRYLVSLGVAAGRLFTTSYGEDKPADPRSNEEAWAKNRRCEFKIAGD